jgi:ribosomal protein S18 acetylase RimI-like enzyme
MLKNKPTLRPARPAHAAAILVLARRFHAEDGHPLSAKGAAALRAALKGSPFVKVWRILHGDMLCGYAAVTYGYSIEFGGLTAYLDDLYVTPEFRGDGIGGQVLDMLARKSRRGGCCIFHLEVEKANRKARKFYLKRGFRDTGRALLIKKL